MNMATRIVLLLAAVTSGLTAGLFWAFAYSVMRALRSVDDRMFVIVMNKINAAIMNGWFGFCFGGGLVLTITAVIMIGRNQATPWMMIAAGFFLLAVIITSVINVPLNNTLSTVSPTADPSTFAAARARFETLWNRANLFRAALHTVAFVACCAALLVYRVRL